ncbi:MAG: imidazole glycerol phosphate synthase subunit HisH [Acidimicrobiales bacterium]|jgi:glutamine amidotransferase
MNDVVVVDYGAGNTHSVRAALSRLGRTSVVSSDRAVVLSAQNVVLPGVGSARSAMVHLTETGAAMALHERFANGGPILGICLGMQLALESSEEDGGVEGLGLLKGHVKRLTSGRVPRLGWAMVEPWGEAYYFAHSYASDSLDTVATSDGVSVAVRSGSFFGVQFHPEKSGPAGLKLLESCLSPA